MLTLFLAFFAPLQQPPRVHRPILDRVVKAYQEVRGYQVEAVVTNRLSGARDSASVPLPGPQQQNLTVAYLPAPQQWRVGDNIFRDGETLYIRNGAVQGIVTPGRGPGNTPAPRPSLEGAGYMNYLMVEDYLETGSVERQEAVEIDGVSFPCSVVVNSYAKHNGWKNHQSSYWVKQRTIWVDNQRFAVLREVDLIEGAGDDGKRATFERTITVNKLDWNQLPSNDLFVLPTPDFGRVPGLKGCQVDGFPPDTPCNCQNQRTAEVEIARLYSLAAVTYNLDAEGHPVDIRIGKKIGLGLEEQITACMSPWRFDERPANLPVTKGPFPEGVVGWSSSWWHLGRVDFQLDEGVSRPVFLKAPYPDGRGAQVTGLSVFHLQLMIGKDGRPRDVQVVAPVNPNLDKTAVQIVSGWRFTPGTLDGKPVDVPARFDLVLGHERR